MRSPLLAILALLLAGPVLPAAAQSRLPASGIFGGAGTVVGVQGRQRVPRGKKLVLQQGIKVVAVGTELHGEAVLEVAGKLIVHGQEGLPIHIEGVTIELVEEFDQVKLEWVELEGGRGVVTAPEKRAAGDLVLANTKFRGTAGLDLSLTDGELRLDQFETQAWVCVEGVPEEGKQPEPGELFVAPVEFQAHGCRFEEGLKLQALREGTVRSSQMGGPSSEFADCTELQVTDSLFESALLELRHRDARKLEKAKLARCDVASTTVRLSAPDQPGKPRKVVFDGFWFAVGSTQDAVAEILTDHSDDASIGVVAKLEGLRDTPRFP